MLLRFGMAYRHSSLAGEGGDEVIPPHETSQCPSFVAR